MHKKVRETTITARLIASFALIIAVFIVYVIFSGVMTEEMARRHRHNDFAMVRMEITLDFHREFTDMRRILSESFMNAEWREVAEFGASYSRLGQLAEEYIASVNADEIFPVQPGDRRIYLIESIMVYVDSVYDVFRYMNSDHGVDYAWAAEEMIREMRYINELNRDANRAAIAEAEGLMRIITIITIVVAVLAAVMAFFTVRSFSGRIKELDAKAALAAEGNIETKLETSERMRFMFEATPMLIQIWNKDFEIIETNPFSARIFALKAPGEFMQRMDDFLPPTQPDGTDSKEYWNRNLDMVFKNGHHSFNMSLLDSAGRKIFTEVEGVLMVINGELAALTYSGDVTRIQESMDKIIASEERNKIMLDGNPSACYLIDENFTVLNCNTAAVALFDFADKDEALAKGVDIFKGVGRIGEHFGAANRFDKFEWDFAMPGGTVVPCDISLVRFDLDGGLVIAVYIQDMTAIKQMLEQKEKTQIAEENSQAKTKFLATMSHEIRTPITAVLGISEIQLRNSDLPIEIEEAFAKIYDSADTLLNIINDILDISKIEAGKLELITEKYEVGSLATDTIQIHIIYMGSKPIEFEVYADEKMPSYLLGDGLRLKQIINNLLSNAFKYTDAGKVSLTMRCEFTGDETCDLIISVADTGKGMTKTQLQALQDEYTRFHEKASRFTQGTGLGMSIVYNLIELMDGSIDVQSEPGKGTTVTFRVPQTISGNGLLGRETSENLRRFNISSITGSRKMDFTPEPMPYGTVLIVDDIDTNLYVARGLLGLYGLQIETATSGFAAIDKVKEGEVYDIIFMDHMMPEMNGMEAVKIIRKIGYTEPIVALTANALIGQADEFMRNGFDGFISKPIQATHLNTILNKFIRDKQPPEVIAAVNKSLDADAVHPEEYLMSDDVFTKILEDFAQTQKNIIHEICFALDAEDFETAHRLVHTLKGLAAMIGESRLETIALEVEAEFRDKKNPRDIIQTMGAEMEEVLARVAEKLNMC